MPLLSELMEDPEKLEKFAREVSKSVTEDHYIYPGEKGPTIQEVCERIRSMPRISPEFAKRLLREAEEVLGE